MFSLINIQFSYFFASIWLVIRLGNLQFQQLVAKIMTDQIPGNGGEWQVVSLFLQTTVQYLFLTNIINLLALEFNCRFSPQTPATYFNIYFFCKPIHRKGKVKEKKTNRNEIEGYNLSKPCFHRSGIETRILQPSTRIIWFERFCLFVVHVHTHILKYVSEERNCKCKVYRLITCVERWL